MHKVSLSHKIFDLAELNKKYLAGKEWTIGCHTCKKVKDNTPRTMVYYIASTKVSRTTI